MKCTQNQQQQGRKRSIASFINTHTHTVRNPLTGITPATELFVYLMYIYYCPIVLFLFLKSATVSSKSQQKNVVQTNHNNTTKWKVFCDLMHPQCHEIHGCVQVVKKFNRGFSSDSNPHTMNIYNHLSAECWVLVCVEWVSELHRLSYLSAAERAVSWSQYPAGLQPGSEEDCRCCWPPAGGSAESQGAHMI